MGLGSATKSVMGEPPLMRSKMPATKSPASSGRSSRRKAMQPRAPIRPEPVKNTDSKNWSRSVPEAVSVHPSSFTSFLIVNASQSAAQGVADKAGRGGKVRAGGALARVLVYALAHYSVVHKRPPQYVFGARLLAG